MRVGVCLHGGAVAPMELRLHPTDRLTVLLGLGIGADVVVVEAVGPRGSAPTAALDSLAMGAGRAVRVVDPALDGADVHVVGFVLASLFDRLQVDLILFGNDADPENIGDIPARVAHNMSATYLNGVSTLRLGDAESAQPEVDVTIAAGPLLYDLRLPMNAVLGITAEATAAKFVRTTATPPPRPGAVEVLSLAGLGLDPAQVRRKNDGRGAIDICPRPLVTLQSVVAVAALLRR